LPNITATRKFDGIEAARGIAATAVVLYHAARHIDKNYGTTGLLHYFQFGHAGVDLFFVLSGFIILTVHYNDVGRPDQIGRYVERRFTRIFPVYWLALAVTVLLGFIGGRGVPGVADILWSMTLLPSYAEPVLGIAWTLQFEIAFYAVFGVLILNRKQGMLIFALWVGWILITALWGVGRGGMPNSLYAVYNLQFLLGMGIAYWFKNHVVPMPRLLLIVGITLFSLTAIAENMQRIDGYSNISRVAYGVPAALIVLGIAAAERANSITIPKMLKALGSASYSIYLFQFVFIAVAWKLWLAVGLDRSQPHIASFPILVAAALIGGGVTSRCIEYPLIDLIRRFRRA
jgi:exopolysaccharide production protein ExoZ